MSSGASGEGCFKGADGALRCAWCEATPAYRHYHDHEWGFPSTDDRHLFEKLCLEGFQAGLSWRTILDKREALRDAFAGFDPERVARFDERRVAKLLADPRIVRHRAKIESAINNARRALELREAFGSLAAYVWRFEPPPASRPKRLTWEILKGLTSSPESAALARDLKQRGWTFVGPVTMYAFMQSVGLVNDHLEGCHVRQAALRARAGLVPPRREPVGQEPVG
ncbi:MAG: 3-methyladenine DNA glycosylase [Burkholderiales bacterium 70-64]|nr:MAG: 3-methyladenine DNA glycosylase [Burkholderiales bacterium 70-64]